MYAFTDCEVSLNSHVLLIKDRLPWETTVDDVLKDHSVRLQGYLRQELEIEQARLLEKIFTYTLERIFIENRLYKKIELIKSYEEINKVIKTSLISISFRSYTYPYR